MSIKIDRSGPPLDEGKIAEAERRLGVSIPSDYRKFLLAQNGGEPDASDFKIKTARGSEEISVRIFLGIDMPEETYGLDYVIETFKDRLPKGFFPIARDPGGNIIAMATDSGQIYYWDQEFEADEGDPPSDKNMTRIAKSLDQFLDVLGKV